tara:strand:+ start:67 stop:471 length:405 start_codon:yes stop_codon:yes gene_type:complete
MIVNPNDAHHVVKITPRFYPTDRLELKINNSFKGTIDAVPVLYSFTNDNKLQLSFSYTFSDESNYNLKILETIHPLTEYLLRVESDNGFIESTQCVFDKLNLKIEKEVLFRTNILATTQVTQDYSLTAAKYNWK